MCVPKSLKHAFDILLTPRQAEVLLESFLQDCSELIAKWELVKEDMNNTENFTIMRLDMARNRQAIDT